MAWTLQAAAGANAQGSEANLSCLCIEIEHLHTLLSCWGLLQHKQELWYLVFDVEKDINPFLLRSTVPLKPGTRGLCQGAMYSHHKGTAAPGRQWDPRELGHQGITFPGGRGLSRNREGAAGTFVHCRKRKKTQLQAYRRDCIVYCNLHFLVQFSKQAACFPPE